VRGILVLSHINILTYLFGRIDKNTQYNTAEINAIFLCGKVSMDEKEYKIKYSAFNVDKNSILKAY